MPKGLRGVDRQATWGKSAADGWRYGHGTFSITPHDIPVVGLFQWMPNSGNDAKRMEMEVLKHKKLIEIVCMDSKADSHKLYFHLKENDIQLLTKPRSNATDKRLPERKQMLKELSTKKHKKIYKERSITVEPMQGLVKDIFDLDLCWMRGDDNNRWLFASMGIAVQMAQLQAYRNNQSTWNIKSLVLGG